MAVVDIDTMLRTRHELEQQAYNTLRAELSEQFLQDPVGFMREHGRRPEDLSGAQLRSYYRVALNRGITLAPSLSPVFVEKFMGGGLFREVA